MKVRVNQFCGLSTSPQIQAWLYRYNADLYNSFIEDMKQSRGCNQNRENMQKVYDAIVANGDLEKLTDYLKTHFPHVIEIEGQETPEAPSTLLVPETENSTNILNAMKEMFNRRTVTFPRRTVVPVTGFDPDVAVESFSKDKIAVKWLVHDNVLYLEYLLKVDEPIKDSILESNWLVPYMEGMLDGKVSITQA